MVVTIDRQTARPSLRQRLWLPAACAPTGGRVAFARQKRQRVDGGARWLMGHHDAERRLARERR